MIHKKVTIKIPAFEFTTDLDIRKSSNYDSPMSNVIVAEIDTSNNLESVLNQIVTQAVAKKVNKLSCLKGKEIYKIILETSRVEGHTCIFPNCFYFNIKD